VASKIIVDLKHPGEQSGNTLPLYVCFIVKVQHKVWNVRLLFLRKRLLNGG